MEPVTVVMWGVCLCVCLRLVHFDDVVVSAIFPQEDPLVLNEYRDDLRSECEKFGEVKKVIIFDVSVIYCYTAEYCFCSSILFIGDVCVCVCNRGTLTVWHPWRLRRQRRRICVWLR